MKIVAQSVKIGELLQDGKIYAVPIFQRSFSWEEEQVTDFWEDLITVYRENGEEYFLGSMVFSEHETPNKVKILDGQQRLATILISLAALRDVLQQTPLDKSAERVEVINNILYTRDPVTLEQNCKLELNREDRIFFEKLIVRGTFHDIRYTSHKLIKKAYELLKEKIKRGIEKEGEDFVRGIIDIILNRLIIIRIWVSSEVDAHIIFETLNDRGLELSVADLVKNYLFSISGDHLEIAIEKWKELVDNVGDHNVSRFLRHFWISKFELIRKEELYKKLKDYVNSSNVKSFIEELSEEALIYSNLRSPSHEFWSDREIENLLEELSILRVEQVYVLLLSAYQRFYRRGNREKFKVLLQSVINFSFRWSTICGLNPNEMEKLYSELAVKLRNGEIDIGDIIEEFRERAPSDTEFVDKFKEKDIKNSKLAKYILLKLNNFLLKERDKKELTVDIRKVNLEHIVPKRPDREWLDYFQEKEIEDWTELIHKIGNLTILLEEYNKRIANKFFTKKKEMYERSVLPLNEKLKTYKEFGPPEISERAEEMSQIAKTIWNI